jgi:diguanylate cyclase (GGDEF)-like protein
VKKLTHDRKITRSNITIGSPMFMAPEQITHDTVDARTDVYALGVVAFMLLSAQTPFPMGGALEICMAHVMQPPRDFSDVAPLVEIPGAYRDIVFKALSKDPEGRYASVQEMSLAFARTLGVDASGRVADNSGSIPVGASGRGAGEWTDAQTIEDEQDFLGGFAFLDDQSDCSIDLIPQPDIFLSKRGDLQELREKDPSDYAAFIDLNCPFCFAVHERLSRWGVSHKLEWKFVQHANHLMEGPFTLSQENRLSSEVLSAHHRAPDVKIILPSKWCDGELASLLLTQIQKVYPEASDQMRNAVYRALWHEDLNIDDTEVLQGLLAQNDLPDSLIVECEESRSLLQAYQNEWETGNFDFSIPVIQQAKTRRSHVGLGTKRSLMEFLLEKRSRLIDSTACYYQRKPTILVCGSMQNVWPIIEHLRACTEFLQAQTATEAIETIGIHSHADVLVLDDESLSPEDVDKIAKAARARTLPWALLTRDTSTEHEVETLSRGAAEFIDIGQDVRVGRARLHRLIRSRLTPEYLERREELDTLTRLPSRRSFLRAFEGCWSDSRETGQVLSILLFNLDQFKKYNDSMGYLAGDHALQQVAALLKHNVNSPDSRLARFGGDEFIALLPDVGSNKAINIGLAAKQALIELHLSTTTGEVEQDLSMSVAVVTITPAKDAEAEIIFERVDRAMSDAKKTGPNSLIAS